MCKIEINGKELNSENIFVDTNILIFYAKYINSSAVTLKNKEIKIREINRLKYRIKNCETEIKYLIKIYKEFVMEFGTEQIGGLDEIIKQIEKLYYNLYNEYEKKYSENIDIKFNREINELEVKNMEEIREIISKYIIENYKNKIKITPTVFDEFIKLLNNGSTRVKPPIFEEMFQKFVKMLLTYGKDAGKKNYLKLKKIEKIYKIDIEIPTDHENIEEYKNKRREKARNWIFSKKHSFTDINKHKKFIEFISNKYRKGFNMNPNNEKIKNDQYYIQYDEKINMSKDLIKNLNESFHDKNKFKTSDEQIELAIEYLQYNVKDDIKILDFVGRYSESHLNTILITNDSDMTLFHEEIEKIYTNLKIISLSDISIKND